MFSLLTDCETKTTMILEHGKRSETPGDDVDREKRLAVIGGRSCMNNFATTRAGAINALTAEE